MASGKLEQVLNTMKVGGTEEYLKSSLTVLKIMQNIMVHPDTEKFKKIRLAATVLSKPGMVELLKVVGFQEQGNYLVFPSNGSIEQLKSWKKQILECRKQTGYIEGWDVPGTSLKFSDLLGSGKFGDVFKGFLDNQSVAIKTLKPDCGDLAKQEFDRETRIMSKLHHNNVLKMLALVLTSDPVSLVLELMKDNMLVVLHNQKELGEEEILRYISQVSEGMEYVHQQSILHCDLAARNILLDHSDNVKISDFGLSRTAGTEECNLVGKERQLQFPIRWTAPEVFSKLYVDRKTDVWSFGILFYEFVTAGSVPYAALSNAEVRKQVQEGHRLTQPEECPAPFFHLMQQCWSNDPDKRPTFADINKELQRIRYNNTNPAEHRLSVSDVKERDRASSVASPKKQKKLIKIKESSYHQALDKGGGLIRVYTALVPPFRHRTVIACLPKTTVKEAIQMVLVQLGRDYVDPKDYHIAMLCDIIDQPPRFLSSNEQIYPMKNCKRQFILCTHQAVGNESMILEALVASAQTNPAMIKALDPCTRGYLVSQFEVPKNIQQEVDWSRSWVAIDGSTIFMYRDEEDEGVKECQHYIDLRGCTCDLASIKGKPKGTIIRIQKPEGPSYLLQASDKPEVLRWIDAIQIASTQEPSPRLADVVEGAVVQEGYLEYQEYLLDMVQRADLSKFRMTIQRNLQSSLQQQSSLTSNTKVDHGRQWSQLKSNGKLQVFYTGKPETLFELSSATLVKLNHPPVLTRSADYSIEVTTAISRVVLKADLPSEHHEWSEAIQHVLREQKRDGIIQIGGDTGTPSGYVRLKRLMSKKKLQQQHSFGKLPANSASSISEETHAVTPSQDEVAEGLYEDAKFIERVKSLMPDLKPPEPYLIQSPAPPPLPPRISPSTSLSNGVVANGGVALRPSHQSLSVQPVGKMTPRSTSAYNLHWARPLTHSDDFNFPGQFQRMDQQYLSFNAQRRRLVSPASSQQQYNNDLHYPSSSVTAVPSRLDYHAAFDISRDNHVMYQNHMGKQPKHHIGQYQHHINQHQYDVNQQHNIISSPPGQMSPKHDPANKQNQQQYRVGQLLDHVSQQPYHVSQQPNHVSQQLDHVSQQPYHVSQQPNHVSQQPYRVNQQDHVSQQPYHVSQEPNHVIQQQYHVSHQQQKLNQYQYPVNQQDLMSQQQNFATQQQYLGSQQDLVRQKNYNQPQNFVNQHEDHVSHQRHHVTQQDHVNQPQHNQQHQVSQHQYQTNQNPMNQQQYHTNQQQDHVNKQWYHVTQQHDHMSHQYHNQRQYQDQEDHVRALPYHATQQDHVSQQQSHTTQQKNNVSQRPSHIVASQQQDHMIQQQDHLIQQQDHTIQQQDHTIQQQDHTSQNHVIQQKHQNQMMRRTSSPNQQYSPQAPPEGYVRMHSVPPPLLNTTPEYVEMNSQFNEAPHSYSLNVPNTPDSEVSQKPLELLSKQEPPRVAPKPSRPPKKSALLTTGGGRAVDAEDMSPPHGASPPRSEAATPTNAPPIPVKKKNSLHRRKGPVIYDQPPTGGIRQITQQLESTSLSQPRPTQVQTSSQNDIHHNRTVDTSPPVAPITTPPNQENTKSLPPGWFAEMDTARGQLYYFNRDMGYTTWNYDEIMNIHHDNQTKSPGAGWKAVKTPDGRTYFYHATTRQTTWTIADTWT